ncbi:protein mini spindles isoform X2 [Planococcus citri]|uniref:protein mini spindles isoform X2 n=1 Tax=Planococcus citri TaxID=170843 RepID=UPI0031F73995
MDEDSDYIKLPLDERCVHKSWKARVHGYEEATKQFRKIADEKSPEWSKYLGLIKKFVGDSNVAAQEKGLEASLAYIENAFVAGKTVNEVMPIIVTKCIGATKAKIKDLATQICLMYIEIEKQEVVLEELMKGTEHKNPKISAACVAAITQSLKEFGSKVINMKVLLKRLPTLLEDRDKNVRDESKVLSVEIFKWIGPVLKSQLSSLKPVQLQELDSEFEKVKSEKPTVQRYLRSQQAKQLKLAENADEDDEGEDVPDNDAAEEIDPIDLIQAVDILSQLPKDFYEKIEAKKWQERKEALDAVEQLLTNAPKLESGDYGDLVRALKKVITKDTNVILVGIAAKCMAMLAKGLKKKFTPYASNCLGSLLEKFKEKKQNVVVPLRDAVDAVYDSMTLENAQEDIITSMESKNPAVKAETVAFLARCFTKCTPLILNKKLLKAFTTALLKTLNESDPIVRDNSAEAIGTAWKVVGEKVISPFLSDVDNLKITKIKEASEKAVILVKPKIVKKAEPPPPAVSKPTVDRPKAGSANPKPVKRPVNKTGTFIKKSSSNTNLSNKAPKSTKPIPERELTEEDVAEKAVEIFPDAVISGLSDGNWKTRLSSVEQFSEIIGTLNSADVQSQLLIKLLSKKPGFKDNNFQVLKLRLECLKIISENFTLTSTAAAVCLTDLVSLLGDAKNNGLATEVLLLFADNLKLDYVSTEVLEFAFSQQKNPKVQQEALLWLSNAILEFGFIIQPKSLMDNVKKAVAASNPNVRSAVITLLGTMYLYMGPQLGLFFENEKPALLQQINAEFEKHEGEKPPSPKRGKLKGHSNGTEDETFAEEAPQIPNIQDMVPRVDISSKITHSLVNELKDKDWKVRTEAINKLQEIISEARFITSNLGEAVPAIAERLTDSNGRLAATTVTLCESIAVAMGSSCKPYVREFFPGFLQGLGDNKNYLRAAAIKCINTWGDTCGYLPFFEGEMIASALKSGSPTLRCELWAWLAEKLPNLKQVPKDELLACLSFLYNNLEDRNSDVRKNANEAVFGFMIHLGYPCMFQACEKLKPVSVHVVKNLLDKARGNLPDIPTPAPKASKQPASKPASAGASQNSSAKARTVIAASKGSATVTRKKKEEEVDSTPLLKVNNLKMQRTLDENKLKVLKWNFTTPREEFIEQLKDQMNTAGVNKLLVTNMFHPDFKFHLKALDALYEDASVNTPALMSNLDLILKWLTIRFFDTNPSVLLKGLEFLQLVFRLLAEEGYNMAEAEAASFLPYLVLKAGDPKDTVRNNVKDIFDAIGSVYPISKLFTYVMDGIKSKNARQRTGCLEQLSKMIENYGLSVCQPTPAAALKEIAKQISDRDNSVRNAALNCVIAAYFIVGDKVRNMIGQISDKDMSLLEERIKRASRTRPNIPVATVKPTQISPMKRASQYEPQPVHQINTATYDSHSDEEMPADEDMDTYRDDDDDDESEETPPAQVSPPQPPIIQPRVKRFGLDNQVIEALEAQAINHPKPNLYEYDSNYFQEPVLPMRQIVSPSYSCNTQTITRIRTSPSKPNSLEAWITTIGSSDLTDVLKAIDEVEPTLTSEEKRKELNGLEGLLISQIVSQLSSLSTLNDPEVTRCYKALFSLLIKIFSSSYAEKVGESNLQQLLMLLIELLIEKRLEKAESSTVFQKAVNNLVLRILEKSDHTAVICALLRLLYDSVSSSNTNQHYQELIMKCTWKTLKYIPEWDTELEYDKILIEVHRFLNDFPSTWWKKQQNDTPLRTYKTIVHAMVQTRGIEVLSVISIIPGVTQQSELLHYVNKLLRHMKLDEKKDDIPDKTRYHIPRGLHEELTQILKKIGDQNETQQGLRMLYEFKKNHPEININSILGKTSKFFQQYVTRGLDSIQAEKEGDLCNNGLKTSDDNDNENPFTVSGIEKGAGESVEAQNYAHKLKLYQMQVGWDQQKKPGSAPSVNAEQSSNLIPTLRIMSPPQRLFRDADGDGTTSLEQLQRKLSEIRTGKV